MRTWAWRAASCAALAMLAGTIFLRLAHRLQGPSAAPPTVVEMTGPCPAATARLEAKFRIAQDVAAGRTSLLAAAASFRTLDAEEPPVPGWVVCAPPAGVSDEEFYCRRVIEWARNALPPGRSDDVIERLEAELDARRRGARLKFPEP